MVALLPGHVFHRRYEIVRCLKSGGMGAIYEVVHLETRRRRALKVMLPGIVANREMHARFKLEATVAADIESEHIVETFDAGVDEETGALFLVMELLRGADLGELVEHSGKLPAEDVVGLLAQAASALDKTHAAGVVHRDLKPENLFVARRDDGAPKLKILDFGIAKVVSESGQAAAKTKILGTPLYMSPEQIRGDGTIGPRADLYAMGHIAFTLLVGQTYWSAQAENDQLYALMMKIVRGGGPAATAMAAAYGVALPAAFDAWFARCTALDPRDRFESASSLVGALAAVLAVTIARPAGPAVGHLAMLAARPPSAAFPPGGAHDTPTSVLAEPSPGAPKSGASLSAAMVSQPQATAILPSSPPIAPAAGTSGEVPKPRASRRGTSIAVVLLALSVAGGLAARVALQQARSSAARPEATDGPSDAATPEPVAREPSPPVVALEAPVTVDSAPLAAPPLSASVPHPAGSAPPGRPAPIAGAASGRLKRPAPAFVPSPASQAPAPRPAAPDESVLLRRE